MARFTVCLLAFILAAGQFGVDAAPLSSRHAKPPGNYVQCNIARIKTVMGLSATNAAIHKIDLDMAAAVASAHSGLKDAQTGIKTIARALISRQQPPTAARNQVGRGLNTAMGALAAMNPPNQVMSARVNDTMTKLKKTMAAGQQVINNC
ncbi:hypothetical protein BDZ94DRAFT_1118652, partial [Collybia nuda]